VHVPSVTHVVWSVSGIPKASGKERFAPLEPVKGHQHNGLNKPPAYQYTGLIPALNSCRDRIQNDRKVEHFRMMPSPSSLDEQSLAIGIVQFSNTIDIGWILGY